MEHPELAIILPAWKVDFLEKSLQSIENQISKNFTLYIFDDEGPEELAEIVRPFLQKNPLWKYHRFEKNLGGINLAAHWNRCIRLTSEKWVWLFSDDDEMDSGCVESFYSALRNYPDHAVYRFSLNIIGENNQDMPVKSRDDAVLTGSEFGSFRFLRSMDSSAVEFIFSRKSYSECHGFPEFPAAWCADDAAWILFSGTTGIRLMQNASVSWRFSKKSISGSGGKWTEKKLEAAVMFITWFNARYTKLAENTSFRAEQVIWLRLQMVHEGHLPGLLDVIRIINRLKLPGISHKLRCFQDLFCLSYVYHQRVILKQDPVGFRYWLSMILPAY
jgi:glycosyltransferase involved in cell wall biosynthesis